MKKYKILSINPGSTSTKIAVFEDTTQVFEEVLRHEPEQLSKFERLIDQYDYRKEVILSCLQQNNIAIETIDAIAARGGLVGPIPSGTYVVNEALVKRLTDNMLHSSNLAGIIANDLAQTYGMPAYITDPVTTDELEDYARITGIPGIKRRSQFHALNQKAIAKRVAKQRNVDYNHSNFIVVHIGGGVSIGAHKNGKVIDVNNAIDGDGPMAPTRAGSVPVDGVIELCFSGKYTRQEMLELVSQKAGLSAYLNTSDVRDVQDMMAQGDEQAKLLYETMAYQISKWVGAMATVLKGEIDGIIITGGVAYSKQFIRLLKERIDFLGEVIVMPGEDEMLALAEGALRVLAGEEEAKTIQ